MNYEIQPTGRTSLWEQLVFLPAQLSRPPLFSPAEAEISAVIGKNALIPMRLELPLIVSHMSYGSLSAGLKYAIAKAASASGVANGSGEGGVLPDEIEFSSSYIYEYTPGLYGLTPEVLERCSAVEIKIGRALRGGLGEDLPAGLPPEVYHMRGAEPGAFFTSPGRFAEINSAADLRITVDALREGSGGKPIGVKLAAGHIEEDLAIVIEAGADFVTIDGLSADDPILGSSCVPTLYAVCRAKRFLEKQNSEIDIIAAGGLRTPADFAKAIALGASAVASASAVLLAAGADKNGELTFSAEETTLRLENWFRSIGAGLAKICAFTGRASIGDLCSYDLASLSSDISRFTGIRHV